MIKRITGKWVYFVLLSLLMYTVCTEYPNPFQDQSLSKAAIGNKTFQNGDTVLIFSSETISVVTYLREHIKEVAVRIDNNRFWKSPDGVFSDTVFHEEDLTAEPIIIPISFYRTGWNKIEITTTFKNDETKTETDSLYARSPLSQQSITAMPGDSIHLKTEPVKDDDVYYVWNFPNNTFIKDNVPQADFVLKNSFSSLVGELYVIDRNNYCSPSVIFNTITGSAIKLNIKSVNEFMHGDTIYTGEPNLTLQILVTGNFKSASVNDLAFDSRQESPNGIQLSKTFNNLDTLSGLMKAIVKAEDKNNESIEKTFYIKYDASQTNLPEISISVPSSRDTLFVKDSLLSMKGKVKEHAQYEKLYIKFSQNGFAKGYYQLLAGNDEWTYKLNLIPGWNKIRLDLSKDSTSSSSVIVSKEIQVKYDSTMLDIQAPRIKDFKVNGDAVAGDKSFTSNIQPAILTMVVSDNNSIKSVMVNNDSARVQQDGLTYSVSITPEHKIGGTQYIITATDVADNVTTDTVTGLFNRSPRIDSITIPTSMKIDSTYYFIVKASDADTVDKLVKTINVVSPGRDTSITLASDTAIWKPTVADTGKISIYIRVTDDFIVNYDDTTVVSTVYQKSDKPLKVSWLTTADNFPDSIIVGQGALKQLLKVNPNTGMEPFTYTVFIHNPRKLIYEDSDPQFSWSPTRGDAGVRTLRFIVSDKNGDSDTLVVLMTIIAHPSAVVYFTDQTMSINENSTNAAAVVRLSVPIADSVKIPYTIKFDKATAEDLNMIPSGIVWFAPGDTTVRLPINIVNDNSVEGDENFTIELSDLPTLSDKDSIAINKSNSTVEVTIRDDDQRTVKYSFFGSAASGSEAVNADTIRVVLDTILDRDLELTYYFDKENSSGNDSDFTFASTVQTLKFKAGVKEASFVIQITNDTKVEKDEVLVFKLQSTDPAAIPGTYTTFEYTIVDDDAVDKVGVMLKPDYPLSLPEGAIPPNVGIVLTSALKNDLTVTIRAKETSTARAGIDYTITSNFLVVKAGQTNQSIGLKIIKDNFPEPPKTVEFEIIAISDTVNAEISTKKTLKVIINDN